MAAQLVDCVARHAALIGRSGVAADFLQRLVPGEPADGLHGVEAVDAAVAPLFSGALDLTTCTSVLLSARLEHAREGAFRAVQFQGTLRPDVVALTPSRTFEAMESDAPMDYLRAHAGAISCVAEALAVETRKALRRERR